MTTSNFGRVATGPQAGFPPTLLARQPFLNAALKNLKVLLLFVCRVSLVFKVFQKFSTTIGNFSVSISRVHKGWH